METKSIYKKAINLLDKKDIANYESDLYLKCSPLAEKLVSKHKFKNSVKRFKSQIDGCLWFDIPFAYDPFWEKANKR